MAGKTEALGRLRDVQENSAYKPSLWPLGMVWDIHTNILVEGRIKHRQAFCNLLLLVFISTVRKGLGRCVSRGGPVYSLPSGTSCWLWKG